MAVNYAARALGVTRFKSDASEAKSRFSELVLPHVDTLIIKGDTIIKSAMEDKFRPHDRMREKIDLSMFR